MSHLNTAYKIGAALAIRDFENEIQKEAQGGMPPQPPSPPPPTPPQGIRAPGTTVPPPAPPGPVNPGPEAGLKNRGY
jgi:hypothetical protein